MTGRMKTGTKQSLTSNHRLLDVLRYDTNTQMRGIIYIRVSSEEQVEGTSLALQEDLCRKYCLQKEIEVVALFREEGESAKDLSLRNRKQFVAALDFCQEDKKIAAFVVLKVDRFARNTDDHFSVRSLLRRCGTTLYSVTEPIGNKPAERFVETVLAGAAEYDNAIRKQRCTDGMIARINQGIWPFKPPLGYSCARHRLRGEKKTRPDEPDPHIFPLIQRALKGYALGEIATLSEVALRLDQWGLARMRGKATRPQLVDWLFSRHLNFYAGLLVNPWTQKEVSGSHQPMISKSELHAIRARRTGRARPKSQHLRHNPLFPLRRIVRCAGCSRYLTAAISSGNGGKYAYYYCVNKACAQRSKGIRDSLLTPLFDAFLQKIGPQVEFLRVFEASVRERWQHGIQSREDERIRSEHEHSNLLARRNRICEMREDGTYDIDTFHARLAEIDAAIREAATPSSARDYEGLDIEAALTSARWFGLELVHIWDTISPHARSRFEQLVFPEGISFDHKNGFRTTKLGLIFELYRSVPSPFSLQVHLRGFSSNQLGIYLSEVTQFREEFLSFRKQERALRRAA